MGDSPHHKRMQPVRVTPEGTIHYEDPAIPVEATLRYTSPPLDYQNYAWVTAWTTNAVHVFWFNHEMTAHAGWISPADVRRLDREEFRAWME